MAVVMIGDVWQGEQTLVVRHARPDVGPLVEQRPVAVLAPYVVLDRGSGADGVAGTPNAMAVLSRCQRWSIRHTANWR